MLYKRETLALFIAGGSPCTLPLQMGNGRDSLPRFYYDGASRTCKQFSYSGMGGNANNFMNQRECENACPGDEKHFYKVYFPFSLPKGLRHRRSTNGRNGSAAILYSQWWTMCLQLLVSYWLRSSDHNVLSKWCGLLCTKRIDHFECFFFFSLLQPATDAHCLSLKDKATMP